MALMDKPTGPAPEDQTESADVVALEEANDVEQENLDYSGVASFIESQFRRSKDQRLADEDRWLMGYRNYRGIYGPEVQFTDTEKSQAFVKITKTKVLAAYAQIVDVLFAGSKFPLGIDARKDPNNGRSRKLRSKCHYREKVDEKLGVVYPQRPCRPNLSKIWVFKNTLAPVRKNYSWGGTTTLLSPMNLQNVPQMMERKCTISWMKQMHPSIFDLWHLRLASLVQVFSKGRLLSTRNIQTGMRKRATSYFETIPKVEYVNLGFLS